MSSFLSLRNGFPCWEGNHAHSGKCFVPAPAADITIGEHPKYLLSTVLACCDGSHAPKTHAATVQKENFEEPHYRACYLIPGDSGHKQVSAAVSDVPVS